MLLKCQGIVIIKYIYNSNFVTLVTVEDSSRVQKQRLEDRKATKLPGLYQLVIMMKRLN